MTRDEIIRMAREGKSVVEQVHAYVCANDTDFTSESMAAMVRDFIAAEREACAKICDAVQRKNEEGGAWLWEAKNCAIAIRARGQK